MKAHQLLTMLGLDAQSTYSPSTDPMLMCTVTALRVRYRFLKQLNANSQEAPEILQEIEKALEALQSTPRGNLTEAEAWTEVNRLQMMTVLVEPQDNLLQQIQVRLDEAGAEGASATPRLRSAYDAAKLHALDHKDNPPKLREEYVPRMRSLLLEVLSEFNWTKARKFFGRPLQKSATRRIVWAGVASFALFLLPYIFIHSRAYFTNQVDMHIFTGLPLYTALSAGLFGAYFSRLLFIQSNVGNLSIGELKAAREFTSIFLRGSVGMCGALVVFFFLRSGTVEGSLFPNFARLGLNDSTVPLREALAGSQLSAIQELRLILPSKELALLAIWCFLAGFSERLVPSILSSTEQQFNSAATTTKK